MRGGIRASGHPPVCTEIYCRRAASKGGIKFAKGSLLKSVLSGLRPRSPATKISPRYVKQYGVVTDIPPMTPTGYSSTLIRSMQVESP